MRIDKYCVCPRVGQGDRVNEGRSPATANVIGRGKSARAVDPQLACGRGTVGAIGDVHAHFLPGIGIEIEVRILANCSVPTVRHTYGCAAERY